MKKYLIFLLLLLVSVGVKAVSINLTLGTRTGGTNNWYEQEVTDAKTQLQVGDIVVVSYSEVTSNDCQYAICNKTGNKIYTNGADVVNGATQDYYTCPLGDKDFTFTVDQNLYNAIQSGGLVIQEKGLNADGKMTISVIRMTENWSQYKPANATEIMSTPQYIKDWYNEGYVLKTSTDYIGKTLRVVCLETADDSYAFLKKNTSGWPSLMSGSDKFSIAGWKYFEIQINDELNGLLRGDGLRIGGNNYYIAGIYVYGTGTSAPAWTEEESDIIDTYTFSTPLDGIAKEWEGAKIPGNFFEFQGQGDQISTKKLANTKNNIIRFVFDGTAGAGAQVSAKDANPSSTSSSDDILKDANENYASYIRQRNHDDATNSFYYVDYADCPQGATHFDFELSDAITVFKNYNHPVVDNTDHAPGVKKGMLSTLLQNGMVLGVNKAKISKVEIRKSMVSKYVSGYAVYTHPLSNTQWRPIALPYNLTKAQWQETFGNDATICELGKSSVTKSTVEQGDISNSYGITLRFKKLEGDLNADYPYIIKLGKAHDGNDYVINNVKADVRDFQSYEFRTGDFDVTALDATDPEVGSENYDKNHRIYLFEQSIKNKLAPEKNVCMMFQSTAPVFDIINSSVGEVENINGVNKFTTLEIPTDFAKENINYFFYEGELYPVLTESRRIISGLAYIKFPPATSSLFDDSSATQGVSLSKAVTFSFDDDNTTGIEEIAVLPRKQQQTNVYSLDGQLVRKGTKSTIGLAKGIYIVNGKKVIVK